MLLTATTNKCIHYARVAKIIHILYIGRIVLKCSQTGETLFAQVNDVTQEDMKPVSNLTKGAELLYDPVQFVSYKGIYNNYT